MEFIVFGRAFNSYGCHRMYTLAGRYFQFRLAQMNRNYGNAIKEFFVVACFRSVATEHHGNLKTSFDDHLKLLEKLPRIRFARKKSRMEITYETKLISADEAAPFSILSARFNAVALDVVQAIATSRIKVKKADEFAFDEFLADIMAIAKESVSSDEELKHIERTVDAFDKELRERKDPWERLDIDWGDYHADARQLLNDPFYWSCSHDDAPHGNDTGADLLAEFRKRHRRDKSQRPMAFLTNLLKQWDIPAIDWSKVDEHSIRDMEKNDDISLKICDDAIIALAFALIKLLGKCDNDVRDMAVMAIKRELTLARLNGSAESTGPDKSLERMMAKLQEFS